VTPSPQRISVVIPTLHEEEYIKRLLIRLVNMKPQPEIIVVDSDIKDTTVNIAREYTPKVYKSPERGISKARNLGARKAEGDILVFLDADVTPPLDLTEKLLKSFEDESVVGVTCNIMPAEPTPVENAFFKFYNLLLKFCSLFVPHSRGELLAARRDAFFKVGGFNEELSCLEDHDLAMRLSKLGRFIYNDDMVVYESMRRFRKLGIRKVLSSWIANYLWLTIFGKPKDSEWRPIR